MIKLRNNPIEGSSVRLNLSFREATGTYYIPVKVNYTFLALNSDEESWSVVGDYYKKPLTPASVITLVIPDVQKIQDTTLQRKVIVEYQAFLNNGYVDFIDEIQFEIQPMPTIHYDGPTPDPQTYVQVISCDLTAGSVVAAPVNPQFKMVVNVPVDVTNATAVLTFDNEGTEDTVDCTIRTDTTRTELTVYPLFELRNQTQYELAVDGLVSLVGSYTMENPFHLGFVTVPAGAIIQEEADRTFTRNGSYTVNPEPGYDAIHKVNVEVEVPIEDQVERTYTENGTNWIEPGEEYVAMGLCKVDVAIPLQEEATVTYDQNGQYEILPDEGNTAIKKVNVTVNSEAYVERGRTFTANREGDYLIEPSAPQYQGMDAVALTVDIPLETNREITVSENGEVEIYPSGNNRAMKKITLTVNAGGIKAYSSTADHMFYSTQLIAFSGTYNVAVVIDGSVDSWFTATQVTVEGDVITLSYDGTTYTLTRSSEDDIN